MTAEQKSERWSYIDLMECIGMFFVIVYHTMTYQYNCIDASSPLPFIRYYGQTILSTCVPIFFFTNGYLLFNRPLKLKKHIKRMLKIILLTWTWGGA